MLDTLTYRCKEALTFGHLCSLSLFVLLLCRLVPGSVSSGRGGVQLGFVFTAGRLHGDLGERSKKESVVI